jgi:putative phosphoesterase
MKLLIFADIHANPAALEAVLEHEKTWDEVLFLGDAVIGGPQPDEVLSLLRTLSGVFIMGNHDRELLTVDMGATYTNPDKQYHQWNRSQVSRENLDFLATFSEPCVVRRDGLAMALLHDWGEKYFWPDTPEQEFRALGGKHPQPVVLYAHSHVQVRKHIGDQLFVNPGGLGQPRCGHPLAGYAVLEDGAIELRGVPYDYERTVAALDRVPLDRAYIDAWKQCYRTGVLPQRYRLRDFGTLMAIAKL